MKLYAILLAALLGSMANAATFLCPDGSRIFRRTTDPQIVVTIDGNRLTCDLTAPQHPDQCSSINRTSSPNSCLGLSLYADCRTNFGQFGKCVPQTGVGSIASDGYPFCGCGVGE